MFFLWRRLREAFDCLIATPQLRLKKKKMFDVDIGTNIKMSVVELPVSIGEALDKLSILDIKLRKIKSDEKLLYVLAEYNAIKSHPILNTALLNLESHYAALLKINEEIVDT